MYSPHSPWHIIDPATGHATPDYIFRKNWFSIKNALSDPLIPLRKLFRAVMESRVMYEYLNIVVISIALAARRAACKQ